jgi:hypothetical protein
MVAAMTAGLLASRAFASFADEAHYYINIDNVEHDHARNVRSTNQ